MRADALGRLGEDIALAYLRMQGYECRDRRWRRGGGEIDLVVERGDTVVFVEIKTRGPGSWGRACESVHAAPVAPAASSRRPLLRRGGGTVRDCVWTWSRSSCRRMGRGSCWSTSPDVG